MVSAAWNNWEDLHSPLDMIRVYSRVRHSSISLARIYTPEWKEIMKQSFLSFLKLLLHVQTYVYISAVLCTSWFHEALFIFCCKTSHTESRAACYFCNGPTNGNGDKNKSFPVSHHFVIQVSPDMLPNILLANRTSWWWFTARVQTKMV